MLCALGQLVGGAIQITVVITFRVSRRPREMYFGHARLCVCLSVCLSAAACQHYCTDPDVSWGSGRGCPLVVHYWADLQSVHGMRCYGNIMGNPGNVDLKLFYAIFRQADSMQSNRVRVRVKLHTII